MLPLIQLTPDQRLAVERKQELDKYISLLTTFITSSPEFPVLPQAEREAAQLQLEEYRREALALSVTIAGFYKVDNKHHLCQAGCKREQNHQARCADGVCRLLEPPSR